MILLLFKVLYENTNVKSKLKIFQKYKGPIPIFKVYEYKQNPCAKIVLLIICISYMNLLYDKLIIITIIKISLFYFYYLFWKFKIFFSGLFYLKTYRFLLWLKCLNFSLVWKIDLLIFHASFKLTLNSLRVHWVPTKFPS